jgi:hypothetical protein
MSDDWAFEEGEVIREEHEKFAAGGVAIGKSEHKIKLQLRAEQDGERYYQIENEEGGTNLTSATAIEHSYEVINPSKSRGWTGDSA